MSKQAITLLQSERDAVLECLRDMGGRATDEQSSTVAAYDEAIAAIQKLMLDRKTLSVAVANMVGFLKGINQPVVADSLQSVLNLVDTEAA